MSNIQFEDYLNEQLKDPELKKEFDNETTKLESAIALSEENYLQSLIFLNQQLLELKVALIPALIL